MNEAKEKLEELKARDKARRERGSSDLGLLAERIETLRDRLSAGLGARGEVRATLIEILDELGEIRSQMAENRIFGLEERVNAFEAEIRQAYDSLRDRLERFETETAHRLRELLL